MAGPADGKTKMATIISSTESVQTENCNRFLGFNNIKTIFPGEEKKAEIVWIA